MGRFEQLAAVPVQKSFLNQLVALLFLRRSILKIAILSEENLKFLSCKLQYFTMTENSCETSNSS